MDTASKSDSYSECVGVSEKVKVTRPVGDFDPVEFGTLRFNLISEIEGAR